MRPFRQIRQRRTRESLENRREKMQDTRIDRGQYWWVYADFAGKRYVLGPCYNQHEAEELGLNKLDCPYEVVSLPTRDPAAAKSMLKGKLLKKSGNLLDSIKKMSHKKKEEEVES